MANTENNKLNSGTSSATGGVTVAVVGTAAEKETVNNSETTISSTTPAIPEKPAEPTKRSIRVETWKKIMNKKLSISHRVPVFNRIPRFIDATKASDLLKETNEFKNAKNIKVDLQGTREPTRLSVLEADDKKLFISPKRSSNAILAEINFKPEKSDDPNQKATTAFYINDHATEIGLDQKVELDLLVFGAVAVSKTGQYIGRGYGFVDLEFALLRHCGVVTDKTIIATLVHDEQVYDTLPENLFTDYDVPVDMIVTPTQVIRVEKRLPRPNGIKWNLISSRRLERFGALKLIKEQEEKNGKVIVLKEEDTDVEANKKPFPKQNGNRRYRKRQSRSGGGGNATADDEDKPSPRHRGFNRKDKKSKKSGENRNKSDRHTDGEDSEPQNISKSSLRTKMWKYLSRHHRVISYPYNIFNRIPTFVGANLAAKLLVDTDEFKNASNIKVGRHRAQVPVKSSIIDAGKNLYGEVLNKKSTAVVVKVNCPADAPEEEKRQMRKNQYKNVTEIDTKDAVPLDMLVVGAVAVTKTGLRLGRGDGRDDLDFAVLLKSGFITDKTVIVATVHDEQIIDSIPPELVTANDMPVDIIVTNTQVIRVEPRLRRPTGIIWSLITQQKLNNIPVLQAIKEKDEAAGVTVELKESNGTDGEHSFPSEQRRKRRNRQMRKRNNRRRDDDQQGENGLDDEGVASQTNGGYFSSRRRRPFRSQRSKKLNGTNGEQSGDGGDNNETVQNNNQQKKRKHIARRNNRHINILVSNIPRSTRVREFKTELKEHGCNPMFISWNGYHRRCILHFEKPSPDNHESTINEITKTLENITLTPKKQQQPSTNSDNNVDEGLDQQTQEAHPVVPPTSNEPQRKLRIVVLNPRSEQQRIESVDATAV